MLGLSPTSGAAVSALPDYLTSGLSIAFIAMVTWEAAAYSPYRALLTSGERIVYTIELTARLVR